MASLDQTVTVMQREPDSGDASGAYLLVMEDNTSFVFPLPRSGLVIVGRGPEAELKLKDASVSRKHASINVDDGTLSIADLGSHNATRVNGEQVGEWRTLHSGDAVKFGDVACVVHVSRPALPARSAFNETGWRRRLTEELERARTFGRKLAVVAVVAKDFPLKALGPKLRLIDVVGHDDDCQPLILMPEAERDDATAAARSVLMLAPRAQVGIAYSPSDAVDAETILFAARRAARKAALGQIATWSESGTVIELCDRRVVVADPRVAGAYAQIEKLGPSNLSILINGESGVGKENAAYAVHHWSKRTGPFTPMNCAELDPNLVESTLFGHDRGAFTGAVAARPGLFEASNGGTIFLDEVAEMPLTVQPRLLRVLENHEVTRVGETSPRKIDVRVVSATNKDLHALMLKGLFREDLYHRLCQATIILPPLCERPAEIPLLARELLARHCQTRKRPAMEITPAAMRRLLSYDWPGNCRELRNVIEYAATIAPDDCIDESDLEDRVPRCGAPPLRRSSEELPALSAVTPGGPFRPLADEMRELERKRMSEALVATGGVKTKAAALIGMPCRTFTLKCAQHKL